MTVDDPFLNRGHQLVVRDRLETRSDVRLDDPSPPSPGLIDQDLESVVRSSFGSEPERARQEVGLEHWLDDDLHCRLHTRSRTAGIDNGRCSVKPGLGIHTRRAGNGR